jgi:hypothetical protein
MLNGATIITHGHMSNVTGWVDALANEIRARVPASLTTAEYTLSLFGDTPANITGHNLSQGAQDSSTTATTATSGETILKLDWSELADASLGLIDPDESTRYIGEYVANLFLGGIVPGLLSGPIHLIGHSRGASVNTAIARVFAEHNIWIDQFTTLDPHPVDGLSGGDIADWDDTLIELWENVRFADNYYRDDGVNIFELADVDGQAVPGAFEVHFQDNELEPGYGIEHSDVHLWYHGTVDTTGPIDDGDVPEPVREDAGWYDAARGPRTGNGFYFSRIGGGVRTGITAVGIANAGNRELVSGVGGQWPNLDAPIMFVGGPTVEQGDDIAINYRYQAVSGATITFGYDVDQNPHNGASVVLTIDKTATSGGAGFDNGSRESATVDTQLVSPGTYYLYARISDGGRERYAYTRTQLIVRERAMLLGDYNRNGTVDGADYVAWRNSRGVSVPPSSGADGDGDGIVDDDDYRVWRAHFGQTMASTTAGTGASTEPRHATMSAASLTSAATAFFNDSGESYKDGARIGKSRERAPAIISRRPGFVAHDDSVLAAWLQARCSRRGVEAQRGDRGRVVGGDPSYDLNHWAGGLVDGAPALGDEQVAFAGFRLDRCLILCRRVK